MVVSESSLAFLYSPSVAFDYEARVTVAHGPCGEKEERSEGPLIPVVHRARTCSCCFPHFPLATKRSHKHTMLQGRLGNVLFVLRLDYMGNLYF